MVRRYSSFAIARARDFTPRLPGGRRIHSSADTPWTCVSTSCTCNCSISSGRSTPRSASRIHRLNASHRLSNSLLDRAPRWNAPSTTPEYLVCSRDQLFSIHGHRHLGGQRGEQRLLIGRAHSRYPEVSTSPVLMPISSHGTTRQRAQRCQHGGTRIELPRHALQDGARYVIVGIQRRSCHA